MEVVVIAVEIEFVVAIVVVIFHIFKWSHFFISFFCLLFIYLLKTSSSRSTLTATVSAFLIELYHHTDISLLSHHKCIDWKPDLELVGFSLLSHGDHNNFSRRLNKTVLVSWSRITGQMLCLFLYFDLNL